MCVFSALLAILLQRACDRERRTAAERLPCSIGHRLTWTRFSLISKPAGESTCLEITRVLVFRDFRAGR